MNKLNKLLISLILVISIAACGKKNSGAVSDQSKIYTTYSINLEKNYNKSNSQDRLVIRAQFQYGGDFSTSSVVLDGGSMVSVVREGELDAIPMTKVVNDLVTYYEYQEIIERRAEDNGTLGSASYEVVYSNNQGNVYRNKLIAPAPIAADLGARGTHSIQDDLFLTWTSPVALENDRVILTLRSKSEPQKKVVITSYDQEGLQGPIAVAAKKLEKIGAGKITLKTCVEHQLQEVHSPQIGGNISCETCSEEVEYNTELIP